jgi:hypothetical protein
MVYGGSFSVFAFTILPTSSMVLGLQERGEGILRDQSRSFCRPPSGDPTYTTVGECYTMPQHLDIAAEHRSIDSIRPMIIDIGF